MIIIHLRMFLNASTTLGTWIEPAVHHSHSAGEGKVCLNGHPHGIENLPLRF